jgi:hypothetical protein
MLHVANGDHALSVLRGAGLPGEVIAWSDVLDQGPVRGEPGTPEFREMRAEWLAESGAGALAHVRAQLETWDAALRTAADEPVLWFEADLTCQLALLHHLVLIDASAVGGLSRTERAVLEEEASFPRVGAREPVPWMTDLFFARVVTELHESGMFDEPARTECLAGRLDYRARASDRWVAGVLLQGPSCFRREGSRIVPP